MLAAPFLDRRGAPGDLAGLPFDRLEGFAPGLGIGVPLVLLPVGPGVRDVRNFSGGQIPPAFEDRLPVESVLGRERQLRLPRSACSVRLRAGGRPLPPGAGRVGPGVDQYRRRRPGAGCCRPAPGGAGRRGPKPAPRRSIWTTFQPSFTWGARSRSAAFSTSPF